MICAGVWHNLVLYLFTLILLSGGLKTGLELCGWQSLEDNGGGVSVVQVRDQSPMAAHLPISSVIYQLDDMELEHNMMDWNQFLLNPLGRHEGPHPGFCANQESHPLTCCEIDDQYPFGKSHNVSLSCFQHYLEEGKEEEVGHCFLFLKHIYLYRKNKNKKKGKERKGINKSTLSNYLVYYIYIFRMPILYHA